ncbi:oligosaccharide flippase family protein [Nocardioides sp. B-3]|nr:oligosaccharide flippase family protein [Nocardioides sp. B-3]UUZ60419.1 oligosaccharide flippase family protein [Nocardioides sp. B-3]
MTTGDSARRFTTLGRRAGRGLGWALAGSLILKVGSFGVSPVMVRLLAPHDFGLYAVALAANAFVIHVNDMGMIAATMQWRGDVKEMAATARTMALTFSPGWYGLFWVGAPFLANLAHSPEATPLVRLLTFVIVLDGITAVSVGVIQRRFQLDKLMKAIAVGFLFNAIVSVSLAANGAGAYSFVFGSLIQSVVVAVLVLRVAHIPVRFWVRPRGRSSPLALRGATGDRAGNRVRSPLLGLVRRGAPAGNRIARVLPVGVQHLELGAGHHRDRRALRLDPGLLAARRRSARSAVARGAALAAHDDRAGRSHRRGDGDAVASTDRGPVRRTLGARGRRAPLPRRSRCWPGCSRHWCSTSKRRVARLK